MSGLTAIPPNTTNRKAELEIAIGFVDIDTITYTLPEGYQIEAIPNLKQLESKFGSYESKTEFKDGKMLYIRRIEIKKGIYNKQYYNEYIDFRKKISKADKMQVVLVNKT
jgi:hypothetical protein